MNRILPVIAAILFAAANAVIAQPVPSMPPDGALDQPVDVTVGWRPAAGVDWYEVQFGLTSSFDEYDQTIVQGTSAELGNLLYLTTYFWRVRGVDEAGDPMTDWAPVQSFTTKDGTGTPQPLLPEDGAVDQPKTAELRWSGVPGAAGYEVEYAFDPSFQGGVLVPASGQSYVPAALGYGQQVFWRVRLASAAAGPGEWSRYFTFTTEIRKPDPLDAPRLLSPSNGATDQAAPLTLTWNAVAGTGVRYDVEVSFDESFTELAHSSQDLDSTTLELGALESDRTYYWRALARNDESKSEWSSPFRFATRPDPPSGPLAPQLLTPLNGAQLVPAATLLTWDSIENATWYEVEFGRDPGFAERDTLVRTSMATAEMTDLAPETTYHWRARAGNENGPSGWSRPFRFTTAPEEPLFPDAPRLLLPADNAVDVERPTQLLWLPAANASAYAVQISTTGDFNGEELTFDAIDTATVLDSTAEGTTYFWRAQGRNQFGESAWSEARRFTTAGSVSGVKRESGREAAVRIYPVPANDNLNVEIPGDVDEASISLFDLNGALRLEKRFDAEQRATGRLVLPLDGIPAGFWYCRIVLGDDVVTRPVIVVR